MKNITQEKDKLRKEISSLKSTYTLDELQNKSEEVISVLEIVGVFQNAKKIFIYNSLNDEVQTSNFIQQWMDKKEFYLPIVQNNDILFRKINSDTDYRKSTLGILEPTGIDFTTYKQVDLIIVPGVAFDRNMNRLGRGKGFYDRFLPKLSAPKLGICFDFQLFDKIPTDLNDVKMDYIVSENDLIWK